MDCLQVSLFGRFDVRRKGQILAGLDAQKMQELFSYLLLYRHCPHPREKLADLLWSDTSTSRSKGYLRKTLWQLQTALDSHSQSVVGCILLAEPDWIQVNSNANLWLDVATFEEAFEQAKGRPGKALESQCVRSLQSATDLYKGDLLEGWYQDWCLFERERLQHMYLIILDKLMGHCEAHHECEAGLVYGNLILRHDRARERTHRRLMRLYYLGGDRTTALRQYKQCVVALAEELGVEPAHRTVVLHNQIRADTFDGALTAPTSSGTTKSHLLPAILDRLRQLQGVLADAQQQVTQDIQAVESTLEQNR